MTVTEKMIWSAAFAERVAIAENTTVSKLVLGKEATRAAFNAVQAFRAVGAALHVAHLPDELDSVHYSMLREMLRS